MTCTEADIIMLLLNRKHQQNTELVVMVSWVQWCEGGCHELHICVSMVHLG